jgi:hypothetical protein
VVRHGRLGEVEEGDQLADADLPGVLAEHVHELQANRVGEGLRDRGHSLGLVALDVRVDDRLAAALALRALLLRLQGEVIDGHLFALTIADGVDCKP